MDRVRAVQVSSRKSTPSSSRQASRRASRNASRAASYPTSEIEDEGGSSSDGTTASPPSEPGDEEAASLHNWQTTLIESIEQLNEKRTSVREEALKAICRILRHQHATDVLDSHRETLMDALKRSVKREKSTNENILAAQAIALCFISLGPHNEAMYQDVAFTFKYQIMHSKSEAMRATFISSLAMSCFIASSDDSDTYDLVDFFTGVINTASTPPQAVKSALYAFGLMFSSIHSLDIAKAAFGKTMPAHLKMLHHANTDIRVAAGENVALMFEVLDDDGSLRYDRTNELLTLLHLHSKESSKKISKKDRTSQKSVFRDVLRTVEDGMHPELRLQFRHRSIVFDSWSKIKRLNALREILGQGLHVHFEENDVMHDIFGLEQVANAAEQGQWRQVVSPNSELAKARTVDRKTERAHRHSRKHQGHYELSDEY